MKNSLNSTLSALSCASASPRRAFGVVVYCCASISLAQTASFTVINEPSPIPKSSGYIATVVDDNGTVYGGFNTGNTWYSGFSATWEPDIGYTMFPVLHPEGGTLIVDVTPDGSYCVGSAYDGMHQVPVVIPKNQPLIPLFEPPAGYLHAQIRGVNPSTTAFVGRLVVNDPFMWGRAWHGDWSGITTLLPGLPGGNNLIGVTGLSDDGTTTTGGALTTGGQTGAMWSVKKGTQSLGDLPGGAFDSSTSLASADGRVAVGFGNDGRRRQVRWTQFHGMTKLPNAVLQNDGGGIAWDVSGDGWRVVGREAILSVGNRAFYWDMVNSSCLLQDVLEQEYGLDLGEWVLISAQAISDNGKYIVGSMGTLSGEVAAYLVELPPFCYADCNGDKKLDIMDYLCFIDEYEKESIYANCNNDGSMDILDYICFGDAFAQGCP